RWVDNFWVCRERMNNFFCFFFQAEDGIRDFHVTGVQTCALPIYARYVIAASSTNEQLMCRMFISNKVLIAIVNRPSSRIGNGCNNIFCTPLLFTHHRKDLLCILCTEPFPTGRLRQRHPVIVILLQPS